MERVRNEISAVVTYIGALFWVFGFVLLLPIPVALLTHRSPFSEAALAFGVPSVLCLLAGVTLKRDLRWAHLTRKGAILVGTGGWFLISIIGALPYVFTLRMRYVDALFESVSGFTTTGMTTLFGLELLPPSLLFWRSLSQWIGGLGILAFFLAVAYPGGHAHRLLAIESHRLKTRRLAPGVFSTLKVLWSIYASFTTVVFGLLLLEGVPVFDALNHALTAVSTAGFSTHDLSIGYFEASGYGNYKLIEYTLVLGMLAGGLSFITHYRLLQGGLRALWDSLEVRLYWGLVIGGTLLVFADRWSTLHPPWEENFRTSLFHVVSLLTTTGYVTREVGSRIFPPASKLFFLALMLAGGCLGSTSGGVKLLRVSMLLRSLSAQVRALVVPARSPCPAVLDRRVLTDSEVKSAAALLFAWLLVAGGGSIIVALLSAHSPLACFSSMLSAVSNIGPSFLSRPEIAGLCPSVKLVYLFGMLAGRLELLPVLVLLRKSF